MVGGRGRGIIFRVDLGTTYSSHTCLSEVHISYGSLYHIRMLERPYMVSCGCTIYGRSLYRLYTFGPLFDYIRTFLFRTDDTDVTI